jgi:hypothetical protein
MHIQGAYSRGEVDPALRDELCPPFLVMVDELPSCDGTDFAKAFMELRKFGFRMGVMGVDPSQFLKKTWSAAVLAASIIDTTAIDGPGASQVASLSGWKDFAGDLGSIERYHHLASITHRGTMLPPIAYRGMQPSDVADSRPEVVEAAIAANPRYRLMDDVLAELDTLDDRFLDAWKASAPPPDRGPIGGVAVG